ncbi:MAG TPA: hypothetical protein VF796_15840 [Humisphaera sp.]
MRRARRPIVFVCAALATSLPLAPTRSAVAAAETRPAATSRPATVGGRIAAEAARIVSAAKESAYEHKTTVDAARGLYRCDCSGLAGLVLKAASPAHLAAVTKPAGRVRPLAEDFHATFVAAPPVDAAPDANRPATGPWRQVVAVADLRPGDLLAWKSTTHQPGDGTNTGHVMVVAEPAAEVPWPADAKPDHRPATGRRMYRVVVIDSTMSGHADDTRPKGTTGVGRGAIYLEAGADGRPAAYHWSSPASPPREAPIAGGRGVE